MKKLLLFAVIAVFGFTVNAQDEDSTGALSKGSWVIEVNTGSWATGSTAFSLASSDGETAWSVGAEAGYFIMDNLALKAGFGYGDNGGDGPGSTSFAYKIGAKYYVIGQIPVGVDFTGVSYKDFDENPSHIGIQGGYAWFVAKNVSIEPTLRYNISMNSDYYDDVFQGLIGFAFHF